MATFSWLWLPVLLLTTVSGKGVLDLTVQQETQGTWKASITLLCTYEPSADFKQEIVIWKINQPEYGFRTLFHWDTNSGGQALLSNFKGRTRFPNHPPGDVSLSVADLEMADSGQYSCEVTWEARNKSRITKSKTTTLRVLKVPVSKPVITPSSMDSVLPTGTRTGLTCIANGSLPIKYRWFKEVPGGDAMRVGESAVLQFDSLQISDMGTYYCEAENRVSPQRAQKSEAVKLSVAESPVSTTLRPSSKTKACTSTTVKETGTAERELTTTTTIYPLSPRMATVLKDLVAKSTPPETRHVDRLSGSLTQNNVPQGPLIPLYVIILIAVLCALVLFAVIAVVACRRKTKPDHTYEVSFFNSANAVNAEASPAVNSGCESEENKPRIDNQYTPDPTSNSVYVNMSGKSDNEYEFLVNMLETEYEAVDALAK